MRTQKPDVAHKHLANSKRIFLNLVQKVRSFDRGVEKRFVDARDYEGLEMAVMDHLMGVR
jgi:xylose isomerase